jgi:transposase
MRREKLKLMPHDKGKLEKLLAKRTCESREYRRACGLLSMARGETLPAIAKQLGVHRVTVASWGNEYAKHGLECLKDKTRPGRPRTIDGIQRAKITALACSEAPEGYSQWSLRLLADRAVELGICEELSHTEVANILKKTNLSRTSKKRGVSGK